MGNTKQLNIKNRTYYFYNDLIKCNSVEDISLYYIGYVTKKPGYNINSVNPLYLLFDEIDGFVEEKEGDKYLNIGLTNSNSELLKTICRNLEWN